MGRSFGSAIVSRIFATPPSPPSGSMSLYPKSDGLWYTRNSSGVEAALGGGGGGGVQVDAYTSPQTNTVYSVPAGAVRLGIRMIGAGGGGGSGRRGAASSSRQGGGGGSSGAYAETIIKVADLLASTLYVTVGTGGAGGTSISALDTNGIVGTAGGMSYVSTSTAALSIANCLLAAAGGDFGDGGSSSTFTGISGGSIAGSDYVGTDYSTGAPPGNGGGTANAGATDGSRGGVSGGGGGGGVINTANAALTAGGGGQPNGVSDTVTRTSSGPGANGTTIPGRLGGGGGSGGAAQVSGVGSAGGNGVRGSGGGGGGGATNGANSGAGGSGGDGVVEITAYF